VRYILQPDRARRWDYYAARGLVILLLVFAFTFRCEAEDVSIKTIETIQRSVVPVLCMVPDEKNSGAAKVRKIMGTGFLINREGYFLTAAHVVLGLKPTCGDESFWAIYIPLTPWNTRTKVSTRWFSFSECRYNEATDVAFCKLKNNPFSDSQVNKNIQSVRFGLFANHPDGSAVAFTGFPLESTVPITSKGFIATYFAIENWFGIDKTAWPGASGSPVYDSSGRVIGIMVKRGLNDGAGLSFARPIEPILNFLSAEKVAVEK